MFPKVQATDYLLNYSSANMNMGLRTRHEIGTRGLKKNGLKVVESGENIPVLVFKHRRVEGNIGFWEWKAGVALLAGEVGLVLLWGLFRHLGWT